MIQDTLNEREFELINIVGAQIANNQRDLSRHMDRSLGTINMLLRRLITKGYIRTRQLNQKKVEYILTSKGFSEKTRKSIKYTLKTISSIGLIKARVKGILLNLYEGGARNFFIVGKSDLSILIEMAAKEIPLKDCSFCILQEIPLTKIEGTLLICKENVGEDDLALNNNVDLIKELAKENHYSTRLTDAALLR
jgi:DNA-binding MarR family transcriptional regulator